MKIKRAILIISLILLTVICFLILENKFDPLARYQYATKQNREQILTYMDQEDIDYIIQQKIKPEQFEPYITLSGFDAKNTLYYELCANLQATDANYIVSFINKYRSNFSYASLENLLNNYTYAQLEEFYNKAYTYITEAKLVANPSEASSFSLEGANVVYKYVPKDLVIIDNSIIPNASKTKNNIIQIKESVIEPLQKLCGAIQTTNNETCGGLILTSGYISYEEQIDLYEAALVKYGYDKFHYYESYPGQNESQLGYTLSFTIAGKSEEEIVQSEQVKWLKEHAFQYGFVIAYPEGKEDETGKYYQPLTLRYEGDKVKKATDK